MRRSLSYTVPPQWDGRPVKEFLRRGLGLSTRVLVKQKQADHGLLRNGAPCRSVDLLFAGDRLELRLPEETAAYQPVEGPLAILWEDQDYLVVDKPPQMPVHPSPGHDCDSLLNRVAFYYEKTCQSPAFRPLYRLDRDTSGAIAIGKHRVAASAARVEKRYYAVCQGVLSGEGTVDQSIGLAPGSKILRRCGEEGQPAVTHWKALAAAENHTLLELCLETGRTHQIRVHMASLGHPLAGDDLYGGSREKLSRQALHCGRLLVSCPPLGTDLSVACPFPPDLVEAFPWTGKFSPQQSAIVSQRS